MECCLYDVLITGLVLRFVFGDFRFVCLWLAVWIFVNSIMH